MAGKKVRVTLVTDEWYITTPTDENAAFRDGGITVDEETAERWKETMTAFREMLDEIREISTAQYEERKAEAEKADTFNDRWVADNPTGSSKLRVWHSHADCPSIAGIASHPTGKLLKFYGISESDSGKCKLCAARDAKKAIRSRKKKKGK